MGATETLLLLKRGWEISAYITSLNPLLFLPTTETAGITAANRGTLGPAANGTISNCTLGQSSPLGANTAFDFNGTTSYIQVPNVAAMANAAEHTQAMLVQADTAGEINFGYFAAWVTASNVGRWRIEGNLNTVRAQDPFSGSPTVANATSNSGQGLTANTWTWVFKTLSADRIIRLYRGLNGAVSELTYSSQTAGGGSYVASSGAYYIGNRADNDVTFDGRISNVMYFDYVLSLAQMTRIVALSGV